MDFLQAMLTAMMPVFLAGAGYLAVKAERRIRALTHVEMESYHREALHLALETGVRLGIAKMLRDGVSAEGEIWNLKRQAVDYARKSVPDAISYLNASFDRLIDLADAKVEEISPFFTKVGEDEEPDGQMSLDV